MRVHLFRVTRGTHGGAVEATELEDEPEGQPGSFVRQVGNELKARKFAGAVRLETDAILPAPDREWLARQIGVSGRDVYPHPMLPALVDLVDLKVAERSDLYYDVHRPRTHERLTGPLRTQPVMGRPSSAS